MFLALVLTLFASTLASAQSGIRCSSTSQCPSSAPCCSEFGFCGTGSEFCLGGCNPLWSNTPKSCEPNPICRDATYTFPDNALSNVLSNVTLYGGNASAHDFILEEGSVFNTNQNGGELVMTLTEKRGGTRIASTRYVHYGTISARIRTSKWPGVVTAFTAVSNVKDEIDWEFPGAKVNEAQTNYFGLGVANYSGTRGTTVQGLSNTFANYHDYTVDWQEDQMNWLIDSKVVRTLRKSDTLTSTGRYDYPTTPVRIKLSLWPAGLVSNTQGTIDRAGGMIDWNHPDYVASGGQFSAVVSTVSIKCAPVKGAANSSALTGYVYTGNDSMGTPTIQTTNRSTLLSGVISAIRVDRAFWLGVSVAMLTAVAGTFITFV